MDKSARPFRVWHRLMQGAMALCTALSVALCGAVWAQSDTAARSTATQASDALQSLAQQAVLATQGDGPAVRVKVEVGALDPQLKLAPCQRMEPYLIPGMRLWGRTRVGLRCEQGPVRWKISVPVVVQIHQTVWVAAQPLEAGTVITAAHLRQQEVDIAAAPGAVHPDVRVLLGRTLARPVATGQAIREPDVQRRQWFASGDTVTVRAVGAGFAIAAEAVAMDVGWEGQEARIRFENGRVTRARVVGHRVVEVLL